MQTDLDTELAAEQRHLTDSRAALARMRERAEGLFATGDKVAGDPFSAESLGRTLTSRIASLADDPATPLFFGRLDLDGTGERWHIGRRHVVDATGDPMVLDWRAPISTAFYRASVADPMDVSRRRRFGFAGGTLTSFEDEHLDRGEELGTRSRILTAEIERPRVGPMRDIVATIPPEQDVLVRAALTESICVQGAPGTGKTAVGLHRAAYLLYAHRERLKRAGVLVVGPNRAFLSYIAAVLPALGEVEVAQQTIEDLVARAPVRATDSAEAALLKHDARMAEVLARAANGTIAEPVAGIMISDGSWRWRLPVEALRRVVEEVRGEGLPYATGRERVRSRIVALLLRQAEARSGESPSEAWQRRMGRHPEVRGFLDQAWPEATPESVVAAVLTDPGSYADGILSADECARLRWTKPPRTPKAARWTAADLVLLDEAAGLLERAPSFGHVVVDEAQDLSAMQCRVVARRSEHGSLTVLGDLAQGTSPWAATDWAVSMAHLGKPAAEVVPLTTGFRVPAAIIALANRLLPALGVDVPAGVSLRRDGDLALRTVDDVAAAAVEAVREALGYAGSVGLIAADAAVPALRAALAAAGVPTADPADPDDDERVTVVPASLAKGLEYDHVVVAEPAAIVAAERRGLHRLYVVLTRAVSRLVVVHERGLPEALTA